MVCYLDCHEPLPMMSMEDAIRATLELMDAPEVHIRTSYNLSGCSFSPRELEASIQRVHPSFSMSYVPDHRQAIAASWPNSIDDSAARMDWGWSPSHGLDGLTDHMLEGLNELAQQG